MKKIKIKGKRGQGIFGLSFSMIFSIILIVFILAVAFIAIQWFLGFQATSQVGLFGEDFQAAVTEAWNAQSANFRFNSTLPSAVEAVCFINFSSPVSGADPIETRIYEEEKFGGVEFKNNFIIYSPNKDYDGLESKVIRHITLPSSNPYCIPVRGGDVSIELTKDFGEPLVKVS